MEEGVNPARLAVIGLGEYRPSQANDTPEGRNANRRVLLVILGADKQPEGDHGESLSDQPAPAAPTESVPSAPAPLSTLTSR
jgi:chemotaxis protein MotB